MRALLQILTGLLITVALFSFMRYLISSDQTVADTAQIAAVVEIYQEPPKKEEQEPEEQVPDETSEPLMDSITAPKPQVAAQTEQEFPSTDIGDIGFNIGPVGDSWTAPMASNSELLGSGQDNQGFIEVRPYSTAQPNIPEIAWTNKVNGWVLVVFTITNDGRTDNIRVLDANPKGIFEDNVIKAVSNWRYTVGNLKDYKGDMVLTQKIELEWKNYPNNISSL
jgi:periplasmic protein TonB